MKHLSLETLAHLVDGDPTPEQARHLEDCRRCRDELDALERQRESLSLLPSLRPPSAGWDELEARLRREGLLAEVGSGTRMGTAAEPGEGRGHRGGGGWGPPWLQLAAGITLLLVGMGAGVVLSGPGGDSPDSAGVSARAPAEIEDTESLLAFLDPNAPAPELTLEEAGELVELTEVWHRAALVQYRERLEETEGAAPQDPLSRYAALEALMAAGRVAVREAPADPFLNGLLLNMQAERDATLRGLETRWATDNWY